jgi:hypothetical protein
MKNSDFDEMDDAINDYYNELHKDMTQEEIDKQFDHMKKIMDDYNTEMIRLENEQTEKDNKVLDDVKLLVSEEIFEDIKIVLEESENVYDFSIEDKPIGEFQKENYDYLDGIWVNQTTNGGYIGDEFAGNVSIKIDENKYFQFYYSM